MVAGDEDSQDQHQGVRGAGTNVHPPAERHLLRRTEDLPVLQRTHQPGCRRAGAALVTLRNPPPPLLFPFSLAVIIFRFVCV